MIVSFFSDWNHSVWVDYSKHPECVHVEDVDFNTENQNLILTEKKWKFSVKVVEKHDPKSLFSE